MPDKSLTIEQVLSLLKATPARLATLAADLTPVQLRTKPSRDEWSANDVLAHLRACADVRGEPIRRILAEDHPTFRAVNPLSWIEKTNYLDLEFRPSLRSFAQQRARLLEMLKALPREDWSRSATVTGAGRPLERTVLFYAQWVAGHERTHVKQVERIVSSMQERQTAR